MKAKLVKRFRGGGTPTNFDLAINALSNIARDPIRGVVDTGLYLADVAGVPTNATNYLRDLNVSFPYRTSSAVRAGYHTLVDGGNFSENYDKAIADPSWYEDAFTIRPLTNTNHNYSEAEMQVVKELAGSKGAITSADQKRVSPDHRYGATGGISQYFSSPEKIVQTSIGQAGPSGDPNHISDVYDVNVTSPQDKRDNAIYQNAFLRNPRLNYNLIRGLMPYTNMTNAMPDKYKIHTELDLNK